ncbi:DUF1592 domain-containing protein [Stratiformator vulcanicus]|uniref:Planctomycete cytochrome C n=1 Tax=Stratiformator vulcanicus TaxID=2527980 RepID=A0A517R1W3_9PLAN|nr:DUF1592 domain-containing protein [Stratiformator vulcanicus]QDT37877.1 Planctomycete cytochrome C [Stratiformator vulcanicus]
MNRIVLGAFVLPILLMQPIEAADDFDKLSQGRLRNFFSTHCMVCHGPDQAEVGLRLDELDFNLGDRETLTRWNHVLRRVRSGEMPPPEMPAPSHVEKISAVRVIESSLQRHSRDRRKQEGRVVLRRLNRYEYQYTMQDLLGIHQELKSWLPADTTSHGFDNIGEALSFSPVLLERYVNAADLALNEAIVTHKRPELMQERFLPKEGRLGYAREKHGTDIILFTGNYGITWGGRGEFNAPASGVYRFKFSTYQHQSKGELCTLAVKAGNLIVKTGDTQQVGFYDVKPEGDTIIECDVRLKRGQTIATNPLDLGNAYVKDTSKVTNHAIGVRWMEVEGPLHDQWPPRSHQLLFGDLDISKAAAPDVRPVLMRFAKRAFRRPVTDEEVDDFVSLSLERLDEGYSFEEAIRIGLKAILCSPEFLYLKETPGELGPFELASRLSYFLWSSMPDERLLAKAADGSLRQPRVLRAEAERMLSDPKGQRFTENFTGQWLQLREIEETNPDGKLYPEYDAWLHESVLKESHLFFNELLQNNLSVLNFIDSDFIMMNRRLARHYQLQDLPAGQTAEFERVSLPPDSVRGGVLTQAAVLKVTADGTSTSPIRRGTWVLENILGQQVPPPPPTVSAIEPDTRGAKTIREQLAKHRSVESCNVCHRKIDPPGFALEQFDPIGLERSFYRTPWGSVGKRIGKRYFGVMMKFNVGPDVDASGISSDGERFSDVREFKELLLREPKPLVESFAEKLMVYATGGVLDYQGQEEAREIVANLDNDNYPFRSLLHQVIQSDAFRNK